MSGQYWPAKVVPAQLSYLAIYNPSLGPTDETFRDQLVYYYSRKNTDARTARKKSGQNATTATSTATDDELRQEENEKLRQIGLAQGLVGFAQTFADGQPVDSVETDKSRIVLHEVEPGWWILASIDLTQLPSASTPTLVRNDKDSVDSNAKPEVEYSSREVSPPTLLLQQLLQAHYIFCLHHGPSLDDLYLRLSRDKFCSTLDRFWVRFSKTWDVLLHGNPSADIFSGLKLAAGGELGFGVGEEEWGSGERAVLEDLTHRTEGLVDTVVSRFGEVAPDDHTKETSPQAAAGSTWLGCRHVPIASDGVIFGGVGAISRSSLRNVSLWMQQIYTYGDHAYGVRDNPHRERRKRRRRNNPPRQNEAHEHDSDGQINKQEEKARQTVAVDITSQPSPTSPELEHGNDDIRKAALKRQATRGSLADKGDPLPQGLLPKDDRPRLHDRVASQDHATGQSTPQISSHPGIPPPIVTAADDALDAALASAAEKDRLEDQAQAPSNKHGEGSTTLGIPDQYMKYLTFGLSTLGKSSGKKGASPAQRASSPGRDQLQISNEDSDAKSAKSAAQGQDYASEVDNGLSDLTHVEPMPEGEAARYRIARQRRQEYKGHFLVGLKGDLDSLPEDADVTDNSFNDDSEGFRTVLRTLQIESVHEQEAEEQDYFANVASTANNRLAPLRAGSRTPITPPQSEASRHFRRLRILVYVRRPFMYCFMFEQRTASLAWAKFYKDLHQTLTPIHRPLLLSTSVHTVAQRIEASHSTLTSQGAGDRDSSNKLPAKGGAGASPIFDLLYDPRLLTVHSSIPNIPEPGTLAAEGFATGAGRNAKGASLAAAWTRLDALNVHSQVLNTLVSVKGNRRREYERTSKSNRGWWVVWMKLPPSGPPYQPQAPFDNQTTHQQERAKGEVNSNASVRAVKLEGQDQRSYNDDKGRVGGNPTGPAAIRDPVMRKNDRETGSEDVHRTAFLVRKASDHAPVGSSKSGASNADSRASSYGMGMLGSALTPWRRDDDETITGGASAGWGPAALTGGIGVDARKYVEGLLSLNR